MCIFWQTEGKMSNM